MYRRERKRKNKNKLNVIGLNSSKVVFVDFFFLLFLQIQSHTRRPPHLHPLSIHFYFVTVSNTVLGVYQYHYKLYLLSTVIFNSSSSSRNLLPALCLSYFTTSRFSRIASANFVICIFYLFFLIIVKST